MLDSETFSGDRSVCGQDLDDRTDYLPATQRLCQKQLSSQKPWVGYCSRGEKCTVGLATNILPSFPSFPPNFPFLVSNSRRRAVEKFNYSAGKVKIYQLSWEKSLSSLGANGSLTRQMKVPEDNGSFDYIDMVSQNSITFDRLVHAPMRKCSSENLNSECWV